jgi:hypothetical protein
LTAITKYTQKRLNGLQMAMQGKTFVSFAPLPNSTRGFRLLKSGRPRKPKK